MRSFNHDSQTTSTTPCLKTTINTQNHEQMQAQNALIQERHRQPTQCITQNCQTQELTQETHYPTHSEKAWKKLNKKEAENKTSKNTEK
jgi:hypothetical protein